MPSRRRADATPLRLLSINVHKGMSAWHRRFVLAELREAVRSTGADVVCLQEVIGLGGQDAGGVPHYEFLADTLWPQYAYGRNAVYPEGHHGNALLSRFPIRAWHNHDASVHGSEPRGLLHCTLEPPGFGTLHVICVHLGLGEAQRRHQVDALARLVRAEVPAGEALVVAGDFNDWRRRGDPVVRRDCGVESAFASVGDGCPRTFPARLPLLPLDRIYQRGLDVVSACVLSARPWPHLSDHLPLLVEVRP
jgi:endonuclease/exonuclease/phosphatase family metal-dependent hydrolase